jgi:hypothetical protein
MEKSNLYYEASELFVRHCETFAQNEQYICLPLQEIDFMLYLDFSSVNAHSDLDFLLWLGSFWSLYSVLVTDNWSCITEEVRKYLCFSLSNVVCWLAWHTGVHWHIRGVLHSTSCRPLLHCHVIVVQQCVPTVLSPLLHSCNRMALLHNSMF